MSSISILIVFILQWVNRICASTYPLACKHKVRYLVLGAVQRQGVYAFVVGNMAESILSRIRSNVLVVPAREGQLMPLE